MNVILRVFLAGLGGCGTVVAFKGQGLGPAVCFPLRLRERRCRNGICKLRVTGDGRCGVVAGGRSDACPRLIRLNRVITSGPRMAPRSNVVKCFRNSGLLFVSGRKMVYGGRPCSLGLSVFSHGINVLRSSVVLGANTVLIKYNSINDLITLRLTGTNIKHFLLVSGSVLKCRGVYHRRYKVLSMKGCGASTIGREVLRVGPSTRIIARGVAIRRIPLGIFSRFYSGGAVMVNNTSGQRKSLCTGGVTRRIKVPLVSVKY